MEIIYKQFDHWEIEITYHGGPLTFLVPRGVNLAINVYFDYFCLVRALILLKTHHLTRNFAQGIHL